MIDRNSYFSGNIGLGTTSPASKFHMPSGQLTIGDYFSVWDEPASSNGIGIKSTKSIVLKAGVGENVDMTIYQGASAIQLGVAGCNGCYSNNALSQDAILRGNSSGSFVITNGRGGDIKFETKETLTSSGKVQMRVDNLGNVGIGTGNAILAADEKLAVNGLIHAKEVKVDLIGWPDYVFTAKYELATLEDVEKQIKERGHLLNIPSAEEVEKNGVSLGEMNKKLLEKVEELTLYIIQMNKEIEVLKEKVKN